MKSNPCNRWNVRGVTWRRFVCSAVGFLAILGVSSAQNSDSSQLLWVDVPLEEYQVESASPLNLSSGQIVESEPNYPLDWSLNLKSSGYCFVGVVSGVRYECVTRKFGGAASLALVEYEVEERFWGPAASSVVLEAKVQREDCPITYQNPKFSEINEGGKYLVVGRPRGELSNKLNYHSLFLLSGDSLVGEAGDVYDWPSVWEQIIAEEGRRE